MDKDVYDGQKAYTPLTLPLYDTFLAFNNTVFWRIDEQSLVDLYRKNLSSAHLDIGVGTGRLIKKTGSKALTRLALADINQNSLRSTARNLAAYAPTTHQVDILQDIEIPGIFTSVAATYLFHCIPGNGFRGKAALVNNAYKHLAPNGVFFGATVCGKDIDKTDRAFICSRTYNALGWFHNQNDSMSELADVLREKFSAVDVYRKGNVAFFKAIK